MSSKQGEPLQEIAGLTKAFHHFNERLFDGQLPGCIITYAYGKRSNGWFHPGKFEQRDDRKNVTHEICLVPEHFGQRDDRDVLSTLVHEMTHLWQQEFGKPGRGKYHNEQWARKMHEVGLKPFNVKNPKKETGDACSHLIKPGDRYALAYAELEANGFKLTWQAHNMKGLAQPSKGGTRVKFTCECGQNIWGKPGIRAICADCDSEFMGGEI